MGNLDPQLKDEILRELANGQKISAVKTYRSRMKCSLMEAKNAVEAIERGLEPAIEAAPRSDSITEEQLRQVDQAIADGTKLEAVKLYRELTGCSLLDAKQFIEDRMRPAATASRTSAVDAERSGCLSAMLLWIGLASGAVAGIARLL